MTAPAPSSLFSHNSWQLAELASAPHWIDQLALWHHRECLRQGLKSTLPQRRERLLAHLDGDTLAPSTIVALSSDGEQLLGCVSLVRYRPTGVPQSDTEARLWLSSLYVDPPHRGQGLGAALVQALAARVGTRGYRALWLTCAEREAFYRRLGWQRVSTARLGGREVNVMRRRLTRGAEAAPRADR